MLTEEDRKQVKRHGLTEGQVHEQLDRFRNGFGFLELVRPCIAGDGIFQLGEEQEDQYIALYEKEAVKKEIIKFVPASGAASRMFKHLLSFVDSADSDYQQDKLVKEFIEGFRRFAFYQAWQKKTGLSYESLLAEKKSKQLVRSVLKEPGLGLVDKPKALIEFHQYSDFNAIPVYEHMLEASQYANTGGVARLHFTISENHRDWFDSAVKALAIQLEARLPGVGFKTDFSLQSPATDTIAVTIDNEPFRVDGSLLFRPAGHGALLSNLGQIDADIIYIKNIDNVCHNRLAGPTYRYKKILGGCLIALKTQVDYFCEKLHDGIADEQVLQQAIDFLYSEFDVDARGKPAKEVFQLLNRPVRVCGMVKNQGEPGGGPFWAVSSNGEIAPQIVEKAQIDLENGQQKQILEQSTHFNPVDLVCATRNFQKKKFNLEEFRDHETGFISLKSKGGQSLKALELPGLWNGSMAYWLTRFIEVPLVTFNPVKTVNDLLRDEHQPA